jgi:ABC-type sugar transport system permease subunit
MTRRLTDWNITPYVLPAVILVAFFNVVPGMIAFVLSLFDISFFSGGRFVGLGNYFKAFTDAEFYNALGVSLIFTASTVIITLVLALVLALILDRLGGLGVLLLSVLLVPWIISRVAAALLWRWMLDSSPAGLLNHILSWFNLGPVPFLSEAGLALSSLVVLAVWRTLGYALILMFAGLKNIPKQVIDAARIDGASWWYRMRGIILPLIRHTVLVVLSVLTMSYFNEIGIIIGLTNGGPLRSTTTLSYLVFRQGFIEYRTGYANALALVLFAISVLLVYCYYRLLRSKRSY